MSSKDSKSYKHIQMLLRTFLALAIIGGLIWFRRDQFRQCLQAFDYKVVIPAAFFYFAHMTVCAWRWLKLAQLQGFRLTGMEALSLTMQGNFFSLVIPGGAIGGDVVKMGLLARRSTPGSRAEGIFTVFMDRLVGMIALFILTIVMLLQFAGKLPDMQIGDLTLSKTVLNNGAWLLILLCAGGIFCGTAIFFHRTLRKLPIVSKLFDLADRRFNRIISRLTAMADMYAKYPGTLTILTVISIFFVHLMTTLPLFFTLAGAGVEIDIHTSIIIASAATVGNVAGLLPFTPGGIGIRDLAVIILLCTNGINPSVAEISQLMATGITVLCYLACGLFFIFAPAQKSFYTQKTTE